MSIHGDHETTALLCTPARSENRAVCGLLKRQDAEVDRFFQRVSFRWRHDKTMIPQLAGVLPHEPDAQRIVARGDVVDAELAVAIDGDLKYGSVPTAHDRDIREVPADLPGEPLRRSQPADDLLSCGAISGEREFLNYGSWLARTSGTVIESRMVVNDTAN